MIKKYKLIIIYIVIALITLLICFANKVSLIADTQNDLGLWRFFHFQLNIFDYGIPYKRLGVIALGSIFLIIINILIIRFTDKSKFLEKYSLPVKCILFFTFYSVCLILSYRWIVQLKPIYESENEIYEARQFVIKDRYIIHAGGRLWHEEKQKMQNGTNSKEALANCYDSGHRIAEFDFILTLDERLVLGHAGQNGAWSNALDTDERLTEEEYLTKKIFGQYTPITNDDLCTFMQEHPDFYVVTDFKFDVKRGCKMLHDAYPDLTDQFIVQIYHIEDYDYVYSLGYKNIIFSLYKTKEEERTPEVLSEVSKKYNLIGFTFWYYYTDDPAFLDSMKATKTPLFVHTIDEKEEFKKYMDMGISGIYTNVTEKENLYYD